jgi:pilus assembly protein CpaC
MGRTLKVIIFLIAVFGTSIVYAADADNVKLMVGRSTVLDTGAPIARVSLTSADIADALVTSANELLINGKAPGTISMFVWDRAGAIRRYEVVVQRDLARLGEQLVQLFPGESITAQSNGKSIVLSGIVTSKEVVERAVNVAAGYVEKKEDVVPLMQIQAGAANQVLLRVRFAEVSRSAMTELGAAFFTSPTGLKQMIARTTTEQFPAPGFDDLKSTKPLGGFGKDVTSAEGKFTFGDFLNLFLFSQKYDLGAMVRALQTKGLFQSLAEPNLVAESGKEASFLAGGEIPIPIAQPGAGGVATVTVQFKEFGIRLNFTPVVSGNRVHLKVRPEVSSLDFSNAVTLGGFRIPALSTRRTETEIELENGQTFAIAGLMNNTMNSTLQKIPGIGDIPILGNLFKSKAAQKNQTELVVMITPEILPNGSNGITPNLPKMAEPFILPIPSKKAVDMPPPAFRGGRSDDQDAAAAKMSPLTPSAPAAHVEAPAASPAGTPKPRVPSAKPAAMTPTTRAAGTKPTTKPAETKPSSRADEEAAARAELRAMTDANSRQAKVAEEQRRKADAQTKLDDMAAIGKAKRDALAAKRQAEIEKAASIVAARRAAEQAKKQVEIDKRQQKSIEDAQTRLKAAEAAYQAEVAKKSSKQ